MNEEVANDLAEIWGLTNTEGAVAAIEAARQGDRGPIRSFGVNLPTGLSSGQVDSAIAEQVAVMIAPLRASS